MTFGADMDKTASGADGYSPARLHARHQAKFPERKRFAESLSKCRPSEAVDTDCTTGCGRVLSILTAVPAFAFHWNPTRQGRTSPTVELDYSQRVMARIASRVRMSELIV